MIDLEVSAMFPVHWLEASGSSQFGWIWTSAVPLEIEAEMLIGEQGAFLGTLTTEPTPSGSCIVATPEALLVVLSEEDKAGLIGRPVMFGLRVSAQGMTDERFGQIVVSDWAAAPHAGNA